jgi:ketosteroid isomerase-like protein
MRNTRLLMAAAVAALCCACGTAPTTATAPETEALRQQVFATERAFARTMADRDVAAFAGFVSAEAIFFAGATPLRGRDAVVARWKRFFEAKEAPFSWEPAQVEVLASGTLALSTGPVFDPAGKRIGTFTSIWRQEAPGTWRIVLDKGEEACDCAPRARGE